MNNTLKSTILTLLCVLTLNGWAALTPEQEAAKQKGILLFQQARVNETTENKLLIAAEAGDVEAMVYLGMVMKVTMPLMANNWLEKAANQGDIYAMYQLSLNGAMWNYGIADSKNKNHWQKKGAAISLAKAQAGDPEYMYLYYKFTDDFSWLEKAVDAGYLPALEDIANLADIANPPFDKLTRQEQRKKASQYREKAAANGSLQAMKSLSFYYGSIFEDKPPIDVEKARMYLLKVVEGSYIPAIKNYISTLKGSKTYKNYGIKKDLVKAYAFTLLLVDAGIRPKGDLEYYTDGYHIPPLTAEQIKQAEAFKAQWAKTHPPLKYRYNKLTNVHRGH